MCGGGRGEPQGDRHISLVREAQPAAHALLHRLHGDLASATAGCSKSSGSFGEIPGVAGLAALPAASKFCFVLGL
jgi:hypothetical protein